MLEDKIEALCAQFDGANPYEKLIEMGRRATPFPEQYKTQAYLVPGCQSRVYLYASLENGVMRFIATSDALISAGLIRLLIDIYDGETPETILTHRPKYLEEIGLASSLSPSRSNGLANMHLRLRQEALRCVSDKAQTVRKPEAEKRL